MKDLTAEEYERERRCAWIHFVSARIAANPADHVRVTEAALTADRLLVQFDERFAQKEEQHEQA